jgi:pimeloyl-ACP methyl ester carboxylesterase
MTPETQFFRSRDGLELAYRELGAGRPLILIHGYFSTATVNWLKYGHAAKIAERGYRVIMPDLRAHGDSAKPHDEVFYPPDILADDGLALVEHLELTDYDLGGYSLGGRTTLRMLVRGASPRRAIVGGMGLDGMLNTAGRGEYFRSILTNPGSFKPGTPKWLAEAFLKTVNGDPVALLNILNTFVDTPREALARIKAETLIVTGAEDDDNGSAEALSQAIPKARYAVIPGNHMSAVTKPDLGAAIADFLSTP